jgi:hypothetical protein
MKRITNRETEPLNIVATLMFQNIRKQSESSRIHLLLSMPPSFWAAFFLPKE